mgnify:CR=1 FL=1
MTLEGPGAGRGFRVPASLDSAMRALRIRVLVRTERPTRVVSEAGNGDSPASNGHSRGDDPGHALTRARNVQTGRTYA